MSTVEQTLSLAQEHQDAGRLPEAEAGYRQVIAETSEAALLADAYDGLAAVLQDKGDVNQAIVSSLRAVTLRGDAAEAYALGDTLQRMNRPEAAMEAFTLAVKFNPHFAEAHARLGTLWFIQNKLPQAIDCYRLAIEARPDLAEAHCNLASALHRLGDDDTALVSARRAVEIKPELPEAHNILGVVLKERHRLADAAVQFMRAAELRPDFAEAVNNIGSVLEELGRFEDATEPYERAVKSQPQMPTFHENLGRNLLTRGDYARGWVEHEWRRASPDNAGHRKFNCPHWDGSDLAGQTILLHAEQGVGDTIQFSRYIPLVRARGGKIIVECQASIAPVMAGFEGVEQVIVQGQALPAFERFSPLLTLPLIFRTTLENVPNKVPYLPEDPARRAAWAAKLPDRNGKMRVGLVWAGSPRHKNDRNRSCPSKWLAPFKQLDTVTFVSLQKESSSSPPESLALVDFTKELNDFADTAALIGQLDLVITVDTSVAHLAGALGKPVWVMLPFVPDWRWLTQREDSPWYPTMRLFRQPNPGDWGNVMERITAALITQAKVSSIPPLGSPV